MMAPGYAHGYPEPLTHDAAFLGLVFSYMFSLRYPELPAGLFYADSTPINFSSEL